MFLYELNFMTLFGLDNLLSQKSHFSKSLESIVEQFCPKKKFRRNTHKFSGNFQVKIMGWKMAGVALLMFGNFVDSRGFSFEWVCATVM